MSVELPDFAKFVRRSIRALGRRAAENDCEALCVFVELRRELDEAELVAMQGLLDRGFSYREMARALGVTHVAVLRKLQRRTQSAS
jgi:hypothetical protein